MQKDGNTRSKSTGCSAVQKSEGFSLLEVLIALAILGVAVVSLFQLFSLTLRSASKSRNYTTAVLYAQSILDEAYSVKDPSESQMTVKFHGDFTGERQVKLRDKSEDSSIKTYEIVATVKWKPSGSLRLTGLRTVYDPEK